MKQTIKELALLVGAKIRSERTYRNVSQELLACKIGKTAQYISLIENGNRCGSVVTYLGIANEFNLSLNGLFADMEEDIGTFANDYDILELLYDCSPFEKRVMMTLLTAIKNALRYENENSK